MRNLLNENFQMISLGLNVFLILVMATFGFMGHDMYNEMRTYPNTVIKEDMQQVQSTLEKSTPISTHNQLCKEVEQKADKDTVLRIDSNVQKRLELLVDEVQSLRRDLNTFFFKLRREERSS